MTAAAISATAPAATSGASASIPDLVRSPLAALSLPNAPDVDVYASSTDATPHLAWHGNSRPNDSQLAELRRRAPFDYYVARSDYNRVVDAVQKARKDIVEARHFTPCERFVLCGIASAMELQATLRLMKADPHVEAAKTIGAEVAAILAERPIKSLELHNAVMNGASSPYRGMSLAGYTVQIAILMGENDAQQLEELAVGALVHDIGAKSLLIDPTTNPGRWTAEEREQVERHPQRSYEDLKEFDLSEGQLMMAYQHHERADGSGYPVGILGDEIHPWAKMLAVADRFEAMTTARSYRRALDLQAAIAQLDVEAKDQLDAETTRWWVQSLQ
jgi:HD-GYP domain-containing protein (c-di-GMP phosphodiesterase class II)